MTAQSFKLKEWKDTSPKSAKEKAVGERRLLTEAIMGKPAPVRIDKKNSI